MIAQKLDSGFLTEVQFSYTAVNPSPVMAAIVSLSPPTERRSAWRSSRHLLPITIQERDNLPARAVDVRAESGIARAVRDSVRHSPTDCAFIIRSGRDIPEGNLTA